jgi:hypothetical protein
VILPRGVPRAITTWTRVLNRVAEPKIQPRAQSLAQGLVGHFPKIFESQDHKSPNTMSTRTKKVYQDDITNKEPKEQLLGQASHCSLTGSNSKQNNFDRNYRNTCFPRFCRHMPQGQ